VGIAFAVGAVVGTQAARQPELLLFLVAAICLIAAAANSSPRAVLGVLVAGTIAGGIAGYLRATDPTPPMVDPPRTVTARVVSDPDVQGFGASALVDWRDSRDVERRSVALLPPSPVLGRGDVFEASVTVEGVNGERILVDQHRLTATANGPERVRRIVRMRLGSIADDRISGAPSVLALGLLIGDDSALPAQERAELRHAGLSHITAVSGWNVTLVTGSIGAVFLALRLRGWCWVLVQLALMGTYVWIVGLDPPVLRAAIMAVIMLAAARLGRPSHSITALSLAAAAMVMLNPDIVSALSFQLSVLATFALIAAMRASERFAGWRRALATPPLASAFTGLATAPALAAAFGTLSLATVPANVLAGPIVPIASIGGVLTALLEPVPPLAAACGAVVWVLCSLILGIARFCAAIPYSYFEFAPLTGAASAVMHTLVIAAIAATSPEGRLARRRLGGWSRAEPLAAAATGAGLAAALVASLAVM